MKGLAFLSVAFCFIIHEHNLNAHKQIEQEKPHKIKMKNPTTECGDKPKPVENFITF